MTHYALIDNDGIVTQVITGRDENDLPDGISDWETYYGNVHGQTCKRTSYNTKGNVNIRGGVPFRANFAGVGFTYDEQRDAFIPPQTYPSWTLNESTMLWEPPVPHPNPGEPYLWDENALNWISATLGD